MIERRFDIFTGYVTPGHQMASGLAVGRSERPSPFPAGTLRMQDKHFLRRGIDLAQLVPELVWGTINVRVGERLSIARPDVRLELVDWTSGSGGLEIAPETFCLSRCVLLHGGTHYEGLVYTPAPWTKPNGVSHDKYVIEVLAPRIGGLAYNDPATVITAAGVFDVERTAELGPGHDD